MGLHSSTTEGCPGQVNIQTVNYVLGSFVTQQMVGVFVFFFVCLCVHVCEFVCMCVVFLSNWVDALSRQTYFIASPPQLSALANHQPHCS